MPPSNYTRGRAFEYRARNALLKRGAKYVMRAAQSKGKADLLALFPNPKYGPNGCTIFDGNHRCAEAWLVQCKYSIHGGGRLSPGEGSDLVALAEETGAVPVFARPGKNGRGVCFINLHTKEEIA